MAFANADFAQYFNQLAIHLLHRSAQLILEFVAAIILVLSVVHETGILILILSVLIIIVIEVIVINVILLHITATKWCRCCLGESRDSWQPLLILLIIILLCPLVHRI